MFDFAWDLQVDPSAYWDQTTAAFYWFSNLTGWYTGLPFACLLWMIITSPWVDDIWT